MLLTVRFRGMDQYEGNWRKGNSEGADLIIRKNTILFDIANYQ